VTVLSVLDQGPVGATTGPAAVLKAAGALARHVEDLGYARFWVAEHHATPSIGISAPEIVIGHLASLTSTLRIGAGGMLLANHSPLHVVEQFRTLESLYPGRIDLGIGRSHGTNLEPTIAALARSSLDAAAFSAQLTQLLTLGRADRQPGSQAPIIPENVCLPPVFLLGASESSARAAAELGLGYAFLAAYQDPANAVRALRTYRNTFTTIHPTAEPHAILTLTVVVGTDDHHAEELAAPWRLALAQHALGRGRRLRTVRELQQYTPTHEEIAVQSRPPLSDRRSEIAGGPARVADLLHDLVGASRADEVLAVTNIPDPVERHRSYERLAIAMAR
jgi:luciferase family oxidoreductase group 1